MSIENLTITERLTNVSARANALCDTVQNQIGQINSIMASAKNKFDYYINNARSEYGHTLLSKNQRMLLAEGDSERIPGFTTIGCEYFEVTEAAKLRTTSLNDEDFGENVGVAQDFRDNVYGGYINGDFRILRVKWRVSDSSIARLDDVWSNNYHQGALTTACYAKVLSGSISGAMQPYVNYENGWQLMGYRQKTEHAGRAFTAPHSQLVLGNAPGETGEALICLYGTVSGVANLEGRAWGIYPEFARVGGVNSEIEKLNKSLTDLNEKVDAIPPSA